MFRKIHVLVAFIGLASWMHGMAMAQGSLDAQFPSNHRYTIEVWFMKKDKPGTFKYKFFDPSVPGQYNAREWEEFRTKMNDPNVGGESRKVEFTTSQNSRLTERQQVEARIQQERDRIEFQDPKFEDVKPERKEEPKKDDGKTTFKYDENAKKSAGVASVRGTEWMNPGSATARSAVYKFQENKVFSMKSIEDNDKEGTTGTYYDIGTWVQTGKLLNISIPAGYFTQGIISADGKSMELKYNNESHKIHKLR